MITRGLYKNSMYIFIFKNIKNIQISQEIEIFKMPVLQEYNGRKIKFFKMQYFTVLAYIYVNFFKHCWSCTSKNGWHEEEDA